MFCCSWKLYEFIWFCLDWLIYVVVILLMYVFNVYRCYWYNKNCLGILYFFLLFGCIWFFGFWYCIVVNVVVIIELELVIEICCDNVIFFFW